VQQAGGGGRAAARVPRQPQATPRRPRGQGRRRACRETFSQDRKCQPSCRSDPIGNIPVVRPRRAAPAQIALAWLLAPIRRRP